MATSPKDSADMRTQRIEETLGFLEHTVDALSKQYADLQADVSRAERRLRALEQRDAERGLGQAARKSERRDGAGGLGAGGAGNAGDAFGPDAF